MMLTGMTLRARPLFDGDGDSFAGNIEIGTDITLEELRAAFDIVALATGFHATAPCKRGRAGGRRRDTARSAHQSSNRKSRVRATFVDHAAA